LTVQLPYAFEQIDDIGEAKKEELNGSRQPAALGSAKPGTPDTMAATCEIRSMVTRSFQLLVHHPPTLDHARNLDRIREMNELSKSTALLLSGNLVSSARPPL
jgi:hypothetical protein